MNLVKESRDVAVKSSMNSHQRAMKHNRKKRRSTEIGNLDDGSPHRKKRKLYDNINNNKKIEDRIHDLYVRIQTLSQQSARYKRERDQFEKEKNYFRQKYIHLKKQMISFEVDQITNKYNNDNTNNKEDEDIDLNINNIHSINSVNISHSNYIESSPSINEPASNKNNKKSKRQKEDGYTYCIWKDCHFISVSCKYCGLSFDDYDKYTSHLKNEFDTHPTKTWLKCDEIECDGKKIFGHQQPFIQHLDHHGQQKPFHCNLKDMVSGEICKYSSNYKHQLITHFATKKHKIKLKISKDKKKKNNKKKEKSKSLEKKIKQPKRGKKAMNDNQRQNHNNYKWEDCHFISVDCKFCGNHYDDFDKYVDHIKHHFFSDSAKDWLRCNETECDKKKRFPDKTTFIRHLCTHGHGKPFHCKMETIGGGKCNFSSSTKRTLVNHLVGSKHQIMLKSSTSRCDDNKAQNEEDYKWEDCHFISVDCKFCGKHFVDFNEYMEHLQNEFDADPIKEWLKCKEIGCDETKIFPHKQAFIAHFHRHQHQKPFHCKLKDTLTGTNCVFCTELKSDLIKHLGIKHKYGELWI